MQSLAKNINSMRRIPKRLIANIKKDSHVLEINDTTNSSNRQDVFEHCYGPKEHRIPGRFSETGSQIFRTRNLQRTLISSGRTLQRSEPTISKIEHYVFRYRFSERRSDFRSRPRGILMSSSMLSAMLSKADLLIFSIRPLTSGTRNQSVLSLPRWPI